MVPATECRFCARGAVPFGEAGSRGDCLRIGFGLVPWGGPAEHRSRSEVDGIVRGEDAIGLGGDVDG